MTVPREHVCPLCETTCDDVTALRRELVEAQALVVGMLVAGARLGYWQSLAEEELEERAA